MTALNIIDMTSHAGHAFSFIEDHPGCTFSELHAAIDGRDSLNSTSRATRKLIEFGLIRKVRDGKSVRHFVA